LPAAPPPETDQPAPEPQPLPVSVTPPPELDPLAWLLADKTRWPQEVALTTAVRFSLKSEGQTVGSTVLPVGKTVRLLNIEGDQVTVSHQDTARTTPLDATVLLVRTRAEIARREALTSAAASRVKSPSLRSVASAPIDDPFPSAFAPTDFLPPPQTGPFVHPGLLSSEADFERMKARVKEGAEPW